MNAVVDGHDRPAVRQRRQYVVWRVEQGHAFASKGEWNGELFCDRVVARVRHDWTEVRAERADRVCVLGSAQQHEIGLLIEPCQLAQQVPDVRADAEIVQFAGVYAYPH